MSTPSASASPTPFREPDAVSAGLFAEVVTTDLVRRSAPRISDDSVIMGEFNLPTQLYVVGGPVASDGYRWFLVNDMETWTGGWVAEAGKDGEVWLRPLGYEAGDWTVAGSIAVEGSANVRGATAGVDGAIYVFGGLSGGFGEEPASGAAWAFDPDAGAWRELSPMPTPRDAAEVALANDGRLYVIGGGPCCFIPEPDPADPVIEVAPGAVLPLPAEAFDVTNGSWSALAPLPAGFGDFIGAVVSDDGVFVVGQRDNQLVILELAAR